VDKLLSVQIVDGERQTILMTVVFAMIVAATALVLFKERTRTVEGTWLHMFEGSEFFF
jgi:hypothetical protein